MLFYDPVCGIGGCNDKVIRVVICLFFSVCCPDHCAFSCVRHVFEMTVVLYMLYVEESVICDDGVLVGVPGGCVHSVTLWKIIEKLKKSDNYFLGD